MAQQQDRFLAIVALATETVRTEEASLRTIARASHHPDHLLSAYIQSRRQWYELVESMLGHAHEGETNEEEDGEIVGSILPHIRINLPANWEDPVAVVPSNEQIDSALMNVPGNVEPGTCAICQDTIGTHEEASSLRNCSHHFHTSCITEWFSRSVRCPVCRNDIRERPATTS